MMQGIRVKIIIMEVFQALTDSRLFNSHTKFRNSTTRLTRLCQTKFEGKKCMYTSTSSCQEHHHRHHRHQEQYHLHHRSSPSSSSPLSFFIIITFIIIVRRRHHRQHRQHHHHHRPDERVIRVYPAVKTPISRLSGRSSDPHQLHYAPVLRPRAVFIQMSKILDF